MKRFLPLFVVVLIVVVAVMSTACGQEPKVVNAMVLERVHGNQPFAFSTSAGVPGQTIFAACVEGRVTIVMTDSGKINASDVVTGELPLGQNAVCGENLQLLRKAAVALYDANPEVAKSLGISENTVNILVDQLRGQ